LLLQTVPSIRAFRVELDPNNRQKTALLRHAGVARFAWNWGLARRIEEYKRAGQSCNAIAQHRQLNILKKSEFPWMYDVSKCAPQEALRNLDRAFQNFFRRLKAGEKPGFPRFKSKNRGIGGFRLAGSIEATATQIKLPRIGWVRLQEHGHIPAGKFTAAAVREQAGRWFVSVFCEQEAVVPINIGVSIGVDLGINSLAVTSAGQVFGNPRALARRLKRLGRLQRAHARKQKGGANRKKSQKRLAKLHFRIACVRRDALHKVTTALAKNHSLVAIEDLNVRGMVKNHCLARAISDVGFAEFRRQLEYKCNWYGSKLVVVGRFFPSSKICSGCGHIKERLALSERVFRCEQCGLEIDRDLNAAKNLLVAAGSVETLNACGTEIRKRSVMKQESNATCLAPAG
jgi:putative transposase